MAKATRVSKQKQKRITRKNCVVVEEAFHTKKRKRIEAKCKRTAALLSLLRGKEIASAQTTEDKETSEVEAKKRKEKNSPIVDCLPNFGTNEEDKSLQKTIEVTAKLRQETRDYLWKEDYPQIHLKLPSLVLSDEATNQNMDDTLSSPPLFITDIQQLILYSILGEAASFKPRWCQLKYCRKIASSFVIVLKSVSITDFKKYRSCFPNLSKDFDKATEIICSSQFGNSAECEFFRVPVSCSQLWKLGLTKLSGNTLKKVSIKKITPIKCNNPDAFPRTLLLLNLLQMARESFPLPIETEQGCYKGYVFSQDSYKKVTEKSPIFGLDCEMCRTADGLNSVTRVSLVNEDLETVYDTLVKPKSKIIDYLFRYSGINEEMMQSVTTTLEDVHSKFRSLLPKDAILCGHSLNFDLDSLKMFHPYVIDTSTIYNLSGIKYRKSGLKSLTAYFLGKQIQCGNQGHSSVEDAAATMQLVQLKLQNSIEFGDVMLDRNTNGENNLTDYWSTQKANESRSDSTEEPEQFAILDNRKFFFNIREKSIYRSFFELLSENKKKSLLIDQTSVIEMYADESVTKVSNDIDGEAVVTAQENIYNYDFMWVQLHAFDHLLHRTNTKETDIEECLSTLDTYVGKLIKNLFSKVLVTVILTGRDKSDQEFQNGMTLIRII